MKKFKYLLIVQFFILPIIGFSQNKEGVRALMQIKVNSEGKTPVHSIQVYISKGDSVFNKAVRFSDGMSVDAQKDI
ncbi:hypothetical protein [Aquirufa sp. 5-AUSEE-100C1]